MDKYKMNSGHIFRQVSGIPIVAYTPDGAVDMDKSGEIAATIAHSGIRNVVAGGNTGEFFSLSIDEVRRVHAATVEAVGPAGAVTIGVGRALVEAKALVKEAVQDGAKAVMTHWPTDPFAGPAGKVDYFRAVADFSDVPTAAYVRGDELSVDDLIRLAAHPNIVAIKYATTNLKKLAEVLKENSDTSTIWVCGLAEVWASAFYAAGARGFTSGLVNAFPKISLAIYEALEAGDRQAASALVEKIEPFEKLRTHYNNGANVTVVKETMNIKGHDVGPVRLPGTVHLNQEERGMLLSIIETMEDDAQM